MAERGTRKYWGDHEDYELKTMLGDSLAVSWTYVMESESFHRLADIRLRIVWADSCGSVKECSSVPVLRTTDTHSYIQMTRADRAFVGTDNKNRGKVYVCNHRPNPDKAGHTAPCMCVYSTKDIRSCTALSLMDHQFREVNDSTFQYPVFYRCSKDWASLKPVENDPMIDAALGVASEYTPKEWFYSHDVPEGTPSIYEQLSEYDKEKCRQHAHQEYLEDLYSVWEDKLPDIVKTEMGYMLPFSMVRTGGMVLCMNKEFESVADKWQLINRDDFRALCKKNNWQIFI